MLALAKIVKSFGTDGGLLVSPGRELEEIDFKEPVFIVFDGLQVPFFIQDYTPKGSRAVIHLNDVNNLADAEELVGLKIYADIEEDGDGGEDFTGWTILDNGREIGRCIGLEDIPGNPCLIVEVPAKGSGHASEALIPMHPDFVLAADEATHTLNLDLPSGLY